LWTNISFSTIHRQPISTLFPYTTLFRSEQVACLHAPPDLALDLRGTGQAGRGVHGHVPRRAGEQTVQPAHLLGRLEQRGDHLIRDRKSTRLNSSHLVISYAVFCLKKKNK